MENRSKGKKATVDRCISKGAADTTNVSLAFEPREWVLPRGSRLLPPLGRGPTSPTRPEKTRQTTEGNCAVGSGAKGWTSDTYWPSDMNSSCNLLNRGDGREKPKRSRSRENKNTLENGT